MKVSKKEETNPESGLPVAVIVVFIITSESSQASNADGIREEDLGACIHPHLEPKNKIAIWSNIKSPDALSIYGIDIKSFSSLFIYVSATT